MTNETPFYVSRTTFFWLGVTTGSVSLKMFISKGCLKFLSQIHTKIRCCKAILYTDQQPTRDEEEDLSEFDQDMQDQIRQVRNNLEEFPGSNDEEENLEDFDQPMQDQIKQMRDNRESFPGDDEEDDEEGPEEPEEEGDEPNEEFYDEEDEEEISRNFHDDLEDQIANDEHSG